MPAHAPNGNGHGNGHPRAELASRPDRLPPFNLEAEEGVLGAALLDNEVLHDVIPLVRVEDFYRDTHRILFGVMRDLYDAGKPIDAVSLMEELTRRRQYEAIGGGETLEKILDKTPHAANAIYHAQVVHQKAIVRSLIHSCTETIEESYSNTFTAEQLVEGAERRVFAIAEEQSAGATVDLQAILDETMDRIVRRAEEKHPVTGLATGFFDLDDATSGLQPSQLIILAARPSMGKTALALNICDHVAVKLNKGVLFVSLEMGSMELSERLLCARSKVDGHKMRTGHHMGNREMVAIGQALNELRAAPIWIDDTPARNMLQITANARRLRRRKDIGLVMVDYIQLIDSESADGRESRQEQIAKISRRLKMLARELKVPVVALSQLNRAVETREDRRPRMADLRESGAIEQDADLVLLLHRPEYYDPEDQPGVAELNIAKNRNGPTLTIKLSFLKPSTRFENFAPTGDDPFAG